MSIYENMIDLDINAHVTALEHNCGDWEFNGVEFYHCGIDGSGYFSQPVIDYCNSPSDAWPIIINNKVGIEFRDHKSLNPIAKRFGSNSHNVADENLLRAAMIVYLEMNAEK